jgi:hypothetical protein
MVKSTVAKKPGTLKNWILWDSLLRALGWFEGALKGVGKGFGLALPLQLNSVNVGST